MLILCYSKWPLHAYCIVVSSCRSNLSVKSRALSTRILMEGNRAVGVEYEQKGQTWTARANKEVCLDLIA